MNRIIKYFKTAVGIDLSVVPYNKMDLRKFPAYLQELYNFYHGVILEQPMLLVEFTGDDPLSPGLYKKHQTLFDLITKVPIVFVFRTLPSYHRTRLSLQGINYIIPNTQIFMPFLMILCDKISASLTIPGTISPSAQELLLYYFLHSNNELSYEMLEKGTGMPYPTVCRAVDTLKKASLCEVVGNHRKTIYFEEDKNILLKNSLQMMKSPVTKVIYADSVPEGAVMAGASALSAYSKVQSDGYRHVAISRDDYKRLRDFSIDDRYLPVHIQVWRYDPNLFAHEGRVDKISLFLSMRDNLSESHRAIFNAMNLLER